LFRQVLLDVGHPETPGILSRLGAEYVIVLPDLLRTTAVLNYVYGLNPEDVLADTPPGLQEVAVMDDGIAYRVTAPPADFVALFGEGSYQAYVDPSGAVWHPCLQTAEVALLSFADRDTLCSITFEATSATGNGVLSVEADGRSVAGGELGREPGEFTSDVITVRPGVNLLVFRSGGPAVPLSRIPEYSDVEASFMVGNITVERL